jgi:hypothetical protein
MAGAAIASAALVEAAMCHAAVGIRDMEAVHTMVVPDPVRGLAIDLVVHTPALDLAVGLVPAAAHGLAVVHRLVVVHGLVVVAVVLGLGAVVDPVAVVSPVVANPASR